MEAAGKSNAGWLEKRQVLDDHVRVHIWVSLVGSERAGPKRQETEPLPSAVVSELSAAEGLIWFSKLVAMEIIGQNSIVICCLVNVHLYI